MNSFNDCTGCSGISLEEYKLLLKDLVDELCEGRDISEETKWQAIDSHLERRSNAKHLSEDKEAHDGGAGEV